MSTSFEGRLFGPGQPQDGEPARASFIGTRLRVDAARGRDAEAGAIEVSAAGFEQDDVLLSWSDGDGDWGFIVASAEAKTALLTSAPAALAKPLGRWRRSVGITRGIWRSVIATAATLAVATVLVWWQYDRVIAWSAAQISPETERRLGQQGIRGILAEGRVVTEGRAHAALTEIGERLAKDGRFDYEWYLVDDPQVNAAALPGGYIIVNIGLVDAAQSADELAAVLAHEVQHVEQRHALQNLLHQLGWATLLTVALGDVSAVTSVILLQLGNTTFSRELEAQADLGGVHAMTAAGIPPEAMASFFKDLRKRTGGGGMVFLSTHPSTDDRIAVIEAEIAKSPCSACAPLPYDWDEVRESLRSDGFVKSKLKKRTPAG